MLHIFYLFTIFISLGNAAVTIDYVTDTVTANATNCKLPNTGLCNLRSAWSFCWASQLSSTTGCDIIFPSNQVISMTYGEISSTIAVSGTKKITVYGHNSIILGSDSSSRLLTLSDSASTKYLKITFYNLQFKQFGNSSIDGAVFYLQAISNFKMFDCVFENNYGSQGGAMYIINSMNMTINGTSFTSNQASSSGGAVYIASSCSYLYFTSCSFNSNQAADGGAIFFNKLNTNNYITSTTFATNIASNYGGSIYLSTSNARLTIDSSSFTSNSATSYGGAIYLYSSNTYITMDNSTFNANSANSGGVLYSTSSNSYTSITGCTCTKNSATDSGGVLYLFTLNTYLSISSSTFTSNRANIGGVICQSSLNQYATIYKSDFHSNYALQGAGFYAQQGANYLSIQESTFTKNNVPWRGAAIALILSSEQVTLKNNYFSENYAGLYGGGIYMGDEQDTVTIYNNTFIKNTVGYFGGAIYLLQINANVFISNSKFYSNVANYGASIYLNYNNDNVTIVNCEFTGNKVSGFGGAISMNIINVNILITNCDFSANSAVRGGGALYSSDDNDINIQHCDFKNNYADLSGGAVLLSKNHNNATMKNNNFISNMCSSTCGGAIAITDAVNEYTVISDSYFYNNSNSISIKSTGKGGALCFYYTKYTTITNITLSGNSAIYGGGIYLYDDKNTSVTNCVFYNNYIKYGGGGAIYSEYSKSLSLYLLTYTKNYAHNSSGSALYFRYGDSNITILNNSFSHNVAYIAGAVYYECKTMSEPLYLTSSYNTWRNNSAQYGRDWATDVYSVYTPGLRTMPRLSAYVYGANVTALDIYQQEVVTQTNIYFTMSIQSGYSCGVDIGFVSGTTILEMESGTLNFDEKLKATCYPGGNATLVYTSDVSSLTSTTKLYFPKCQRGDYYADQSCVKCPTGKYSLIDNSDNTVTTCSTCPTEVDSCFGDKIILQSGQWRITELAETYFSCPYGSEACIGGNTTGNTSCNTGYTGPLCSVCDVGYFYSVSATACSICPSFNSLYITLSMSLPVAAIVLIIILIIIFHNPNKKRKGGGEGWGGFYDRLVLAVGNDIDAALEEKVKDGKIDDSEEAKKAEEKRKKQEKLRLTILQIMSKWKIIVSVTQITSSFSTNINIDFPFPFSTFLGYLSNMNMSIFTIISVNCIKPKYDYIDGMIATTLTPIFVTGVLLLLYTIQHLKIVYGKYLVDGYEKKTEIQSRLFAAGAQYFTMFLLLTFLVLPGVTINIAGAFSCTNVDPDETLTTPQKYLNTDMKINCSSDRYKFGFYWAVFMCIVYPIGIPTMQFVLLYRNRQKIMDRLNQDESKFADIFSGSIFNDIRTIKFLFNSYKPQHWYWEIIETARRLFFTVGLTIISSNTNIQCVIGILAAIAFCKIYGANNPFLASDNNVCQEYSEYQILFTLLGGYMIYKNVLGEYSWGETVIGIVLLVVNFSVVILAAFYSVEGYFSERVEIAEEVKGLEAGIVGEEKSLLGETDINNEAISTAFDNLLVDNDMTVEEILNILETSSDDANKDAEEYEEGEEEKDEDDDQKEDDASSDSYSENGEGSKVDSKNNKESDRQDYDGKSEVDMEDDISNIELNENDKK